MISGVSSGSWYSNFFKDMEKKVDTETQNNFKKELESNKLETETNNSVTVEFSKDYLDAKMEHRRKIFQALVESKESDNQ